MKKNSVVTVYILSFFLSGCCFNNAYDPTTLAPSTHNAIWKPYKSTTIVTAKFCKPLVPPNIEKEKLTLAELVDIALINNPDTKKSWAEAKAAAASYGQSLSKYFPEIDLKGSFIRQRQAFYNVALPRRETHLVHYYQTITTPEASLSYTIYDFGQRKFSSEIARQSLFYADLSHNQEIQTVLQVVMKDYYDYQLQKQQLIALKADLNDADVSLDAAVEQFQNGTASVGDVIQAKTKFLQTKMELISQTKRVENSFASLASNVGLPANIRFKVQDFPNEVFPSDHLENVSSLIAKAQEKRQDLFAAQANVKANEANVSYAKRHGLPVIDTELDLGKNFYDKGLTEDYHFSVLIKLNYPLFKGFYYKNEKRNALAKLQKAKALLEQMELSVIKDVTTSHFNVKSSAETVQCAKDYLSAAEERFDIAISNYKAGTAPILDVISAQSSLADARAKNAKAKKDWFVSLADLAYATGSLCINEESKCQ